MIERKEAILFHTITKNNSNIIHNVEANKMCIAPLQKLLSFSLLQIKQKKNFKNINQKKIGTGLDHNLKKAL